MGGTGNLKIIEHYIGCKVAFVKIVALLSGRIDCDVREGDTFESKYQRSLSTKM